MKKCDRVRSPQGATPCPDGACCTKAGVMLGSGYESIRGQEESWTNWARTPHGRRARCLGCTESRTSMKCTLRFHARLQAKSGHQLAASPLFSPPEAALLPNARIGVSLAPSGGPCRVALWQHRIPCISYAAFRVAFQVAFRDGGSYARCASHCSITSHHQH